MDAMPKLHSDDYDMLSLHNSITPTYVFFYERDWSKILCSHRLTFTPNTKKTETVAAAIKKIMYWQKASRLQSRAALLYLEPLLTIPSLFS